MFLLCVKIFSLYEFLTSRTRGEEYSYPVFWRSLLQILAFIPASLSYITLYFTWCVQVLRSPKEAFAAAMQSWRERCEKCVCLQGDYVEK